MTPKKILITGGSGLVGQRLTELLLGKGYEVAWLGRKPTDRVHSFLWNIDEWTLESKALKWADAIIHLAGANVAGRRWTAAWKKEILESRTQSTKLLFENLKAHPNHVRTFLAASAVGLYGFSLTDELLTEESKPGPDFLAQVVKEWEGQVDKISTLEIRTAKLRTGITLSKKGGALVQMANPVKWFIGSPLGSGKQYVSWIHIDDLCNMFIHLLENENLSGAFNASAPLAVTNRELTKAIAHQLNRPLIFPHVPAFVLKIVIGEMADMVLQGSNVSSKKIQNTGFRFSFEKLEDALSDLLD